METMLNHVRVAKQFTFVAINDVFGYKRHGYIVSNSKPSF